MDYKGWIESWKLFGYECDSHWWNVLLFKCDMLQLIALSRNRIGFSCKRDHVDANKRVLMRTLNVCRCEWAKVEVRCEWSKVWIHIMVTWTKVDNESSSFNGKVDFRILEAEIRIWLIWFAIIVARSFLVSRIGEEAQNFIFSPCCFKETTLFTHKLKSFQNLEIFFGGFHLCPTNIASWTSSSFSEHHETTYLLSETLNPNNTNTLNEESSISYSPLRS